MTRPTPQPSGRPETFDTDIEKKELEWWKLYSEVESEICWVQPPRVHRILRRGYVQDILKTSGKGKRVLELGCGDGWLTLLIAQNGVTKVTGLDFSPEQIELARNKAKASGLEDNVRFICQSATEHVTCGEKYDSVIVHGFLHHLSVSQILVVLKQASMLLESNGDLLVFEPTRYKVSFSREEMSVKMSRRILNFLKALPSKGRKYYLRRYSAKELLTRVTVSSRSWGRPPFGPSPKEIPFEPNEIPTYASSLFALQAKRECMAVSHLVMQEWLLREISHPISTRILIPFVSVIAEALDKVLASSSFKYPDLWYFTLYHFRRC